MPDGPSASKNASCGLTATACGATASTMPQQKRVMSPRSSTGKQIRARVEPDHELAPLPLDLRGDPVAEGERRNGHPRTA